MRLKRGKVFILLSIFIVLLIPTVFAAGLPPVGQVMERVIQSIEEIFSPIFRALFGLYTSDEFLFVKVLLFILIFIGARVGVGAIPNLGEQKFVVNVVALVAALLAVRYISETTITRLILLPYGALGIALATIIPFIIWFFFVHKNITSSLGRKLAWLLFGVIMVGLWLSRRNEISEFGNYIYISMLILTILIIIFDKRVRRYFDDRASYEHVRNMIQNNINRKKRDYQLALEADDKDSMKRILKEIKDLEDQKHNYS